jgi:hypothetical protein
MKANYPIKDGGNTQRKRGAPHEKVIFKTKWAQMSELANSYTESVCHNCVPLVLITDIED